MISLICNLCQKSVSVQKELETDRNVVVWGCGHCFHSSCINASEANGLCPQCRMNGTLLRAVKTKDITFSQVKPHTRPNLEGHF